jgi:hypothetical protein
LRFIRDDLLLARILSSLEASRTCQLSASLERAKDGSPLPKRPDVVRADALLRRIGEELAGRWVTRASGPFGEGAPAPPEVVWSE